MKTPVLVDGVLYVPVFFLMSLSDNSIVDFSKDGAAAPLDTDIVIDKASSGAEGLTLPAAKAGVISAPDGADPAESMSSILIRFW